MVSSCKLIKGVPVIDSRFHDSSLALTRAEIDLNGLRHNIRVIRNVVGESEILGVVKANGYGHGAVPIVQTLKLEGIRFFAVSNVEEAIELRLAGIDDRILVFASPLQHQISSYLEYGLEITVSSLRVAEFVYSAASADKPLVCHVKVDTGMGRLGIHPDEVEQVFGFLGRRDQVRIAGLWTHFATADEEDLSFAREQLERFDRIARPLQDEVEFIHLANSAAVMRLPDCYQRYTNALVRPGLALYGLTDWPVDAHSAELKPVMRVVSRVTHVKEIPAGTSVSYGRNWFAPRTSRIAVVGVGYADGYPRVLSNRSHVGWKNGHYPVVGSICMDMMMVDFGDPDQQDKDVREGDEIVLFGPDGPSAQQVAAWAGTIPYEICCGISPRVPRIYINQTNPVDSRADG